MRNVKELDQQAETENTKTGQIIIIKKPITSLKKNIFHLCELSVEQRQLMSKCTRIKMRMNVDPDLWGITPTLEPRPPFKN